VKAAFLSEAAWIDRHRAVMYPRIFLTIYAVAIIAVLALSTHMLTPWGKPVGTDFMDVWAAGRLALDHNPAAAYDYKQHFAIQQAALPYKDGQKAPFYGWHYPPMFLTVAALLALFPYGVALALWMIATLPVYLAAVRGIMPGREATTAALGFPGVFVNLGHGQNAFLTAGLLGGGLLLLEKRPVLAGVLFGLMAYKPQFGLLLPLALLAGGHWRAIFAAAATVIGTAALSWLIFGRETWRAFIGSFTLTQAYVLEQGDTGWEKIQSVFSAVRMLGGGVTLAYAMQGFCTLLVAAVVVWIWRKPGDMALKGAALATATLMATPYALDYDLVVLALPIAWLAAHGIKRGFQPWEKIILLAAWLLPLFARMAGFYLHLPLASLVLAALLTIIARRVMQEGKGEAR
jgi:alpha-1,2-mannosyltransferase